jgi:hypothetical protein
MNWIELPSKVQGCIDLMGSKMRRQFLRGRGQIELKKGSGAIHFGQSRPDVEPQDGVNVGVRAKALDQLLRQISTATGNRYAQSQESTLSVGSVRLSAQP